MRSRASLNRRCSTLEPEKLTADHMRRFLNIWTIIGLLLVILGWGPLFLIIFLADIGVWPDPNPNPIGPGLLYFFTFFPAVICLAIGIAIGVRRGRPANTQPELPQGMQSLSDTKPDLTPEQIAYINSNSFAGTAGIFYFWYMGVIGAFFNNLSNLYWPHVVANARQDAWNAGNWQSFEEFQKRNDDADSFCKILLIVGGGLLVILFLI